VTNFCTIIAQFSRPVDAFVHLTNILFAHNCCANTMTEKKSLKPNFYSVELNRTEWKVPKRYQKLTPIGLGAYGQVWLVLLFVTLLCFMFV